MDRRWKTRKRPKYVPKDPKPVEICRVLPHRLAHIPGAVEWLLSVRKNRIDTRVGYELNKLYSQLSELVKNQNNKN